MHWFAFNENLRNKQKLAEYTHKHRLTRILQWEGGCFSCLGSALE